ncbi:MAG TPA: YHS domain protein [Microscillaceae bacterium]|nr:YHS domain protein [Microscillaceae bacterium]
MRQISTLLFALVLFFGAQASFSQSVLTNAEKVAINGYDVVAYHKQNKAVKGTTKHQTTHQGAKYYFSSKAHKKAFVKNPTAYLPQYGGYCAFAIAAKGQKVPVNPETFKIVDGKLYLFFNDMYQGKKMNTKVYWDKNENSNITKADSNWESIKNK